MASFCHRRFSITSLFKPSNAFALVLSFTFLGVSEYFNDVLEDQHIKAWRNIWANGRVDIMGDPETAKVTYAAYYYIISSIPITNDSDLSFVGLSPGDLAHGSYYKASITISE